jgi:hypothetical protein
MTDGWTRLPGDADVPALRQLLEQSGEHRQWGRPRTVIPSCPGWRSGPKFGDVLTARSSVCNRTRHT